MPLTPKCFGAVWRWRSCRARVKPLLLGSLCRCAWSHRRLCWAARVAVLGAEAREACGLKPLPPAHRPPRVCTSSLERDSCGTSAHSQIKYILRLSFARLCVQRWNGPGSFSVASGETLLTGCPCTNLVSLCREHVCVCVCVCMCMCIRACDFIVLAHASFSLCVHACTCVIC